MTVNTQQYAGYGLSKGTLMDISDFASAKEQYLSAPSDDTRYWVQYYFQMAHSDLKMDKNAGRISNSTLTHILDLLKEGI